MEIDDNAPAGTPAATDAPGDDGQTHQAEPMPDDAPDCVCVMIDRHAQGAFTFTTAKRPDDYVPAGVIEIIPPQKSEGERYIRIVIWNKETAWAAMEIMLNQPEPPRIILPFG